MKKKSKKTGWLAKSPVTNHESLTCQVRQQVVDSGFTLSGTVLSVGETVEFESGFRKKELVLLTNDYRPQPVRFEFLNNSTDLLGGLAEGEWVEVPFRIEGKKWGEKILNNLIGTALFKQNEVETGDKKSTRKKKCRSFKTNKKDKVKASGQ